MVHVTYAGVVCPQHVSATARYRGFVKYCASYSSYQRDRANTRQAGRFDDENSAIGKGHAHG